MTHIQINYAFLLFWSIFVEIHWKLLFLVQKVTLSERSLEKLGKFVLLNKLEKGQVQRKIWNSCKPSFLYKQSNGPIVIKTVFPQKMSHKQIIYVFLLFWSIFELIRWKLLFGQKKNISERNSEIIRKFVFLKKFFKGANPVEN